MLPLLSAIACLQRKALPEKIKAEAALASLKSARAQLIQSEKMASLGEPTTGIAHEIQNPLNFVNNFSGVNTELIVEMQQEMDKGNYIDAKAISNDIRGNELEGYEPSLDVTTKPAGQGTGLGLSLSCDIVKAHGGEINVDTKGVNLPSLLSDWQ